MFNVLLCEPQKVGIKLTLSKQKIYSCFYNYKDFLLAQIQSDAEVKKEGNLRQMKNRYMWEKSCFPSFSAGFKALFRYMALYVLKPWNKWKGTQFLFSDQASIKKKG